jgi:UDP-GlcNAc:undecaprenyl-phosphate GlcNAc-1-phosphate transferase
MADGVKTTAASSAEGVTGNAFFRKYDYLPMLLAAGLLVVPRVGRIFMDAGLRWLYVLLLSFFISYALIPLCIYCARKWEVLDRPSARKVHYVATPLLGGAAVFTAFVTAILLNGIFTVKLAAILSAAGLLFAVGIFDDIREVPAAVKMAVQVLCAAGIIMTGIVLKVLPDDWGPMAMAGNTALTLIWIVGITNAMNFADGMDGMAAGLGAIISLFLGIVAFQTDQPSLGWVAVAMLGSCLGFMPYNFRVNGKALVFLGDAGSTVIGFTLACVAVYGDWSDHSPVVALASPLLIFWILIFDMVHISVDRVLSGKVLNLKQWIEYVGQDHLHHRIARALGGKKRSVLFIYLMSICLGLSAVLLRNANSADALILVSQALILVVLITILERRGRNLADQNGRHPETREDGSSNLPPQVP